MSMEPWPAAPSGDIIASCGCCGAELRRALVAPPVDRRAAGPAPDRPRDAAPRLEEVPRADVLREEPREAVPRVVERVDVRDAPLRPRVLLPRLAVPRLVVLRRALLAVPRPPLVFARVPVLLLRVDVRRLAVDRERVAPLADPRLLDDRVLVARFLAPPPELLLESDVRLPDDLFAIPPPSVVSASGAALRVFGRSRPECV